MATRVAGLARRIGVKEEVAFTGGVAKNAGFVRALEESLRVRLKIPEEPQLAAALGAAAVARDEAAKKTLA